MKYLIFRASHFNTLLISLALIGCSSQRDVNVYSAEPSVLTAHEQSTKRSLLDVFETWEGAPYRLGGSDLSGVDCSAFVQTAFKDALGLSLPRTTLAQVQIGKQVDHSQAHVGDLVFFKTAPKVRHVGVYMGNKQFMHASTSKGVIISRLDNPYWASKYWQVRRVSYSPERN